MFNYVMVYVAEVIAIALIWIIGTIIYLKNRKKGIAKFLGISFAIFMVVFAVSFIFEKPQMDLKKIENIEVKTEANISKPKTFYHFRNVTDKVKVNGNIDTNTIGEYNVEFSLKTLLGEYKVQDTVKVEDTTPPDITLEGEEEYKQSYSKKYEEPGFNAIDINDGDLKDKVEVTVEKLNDEEYNIKYTVSDSAGNKAEKIRHAIVVDDVPPQITLNGSSNTYIKQNEEYKENGAKAVDEKDGDLTDKIEISGEVDSSKLGEYTITYKVSDTKGNEAVQTRKVTVSSPDTINAQNGENGEKGVIYLTFDDGPTTSSTPKILDILKEKNVKATFFILNYDDSGERLVKREHDEGHTVAIHGYSHKYEQIYTSVDAYMNNLTKLQDKIKNSLGGYTATITRFPGGSSNTVSRKYCQGIMTTLSKEVVNRGFTYFDWNVNCGDADTAKTSDAVYNNVVKGLSKSRANVVLMHDFANNTKTINALADIIDYGYANGYVFKPITKDTQMVTHKPNN